jgi:hypothetical protein
MRSTLLTFTKHTIGRVRRRTSPLNTVNFVTCQYSSGKYIFHS